MQNSIDRNFLGIIGGLGPLASNYFLDKFYRMQLASAKSEQDLARVIAIFDPQIPDRTQYLCSNKEYDLIKIIRSHLNKLYFMEVDAIIILCFTIHAILEKLPNHLTEKIRSLISLTLHIVAQEKNKILLLSTFAVNKFKIFQCDKYWDKAYQYIKLLDFDDAYKIHKMIYDLKLGKISNNAYEILYHLQVKYGTSGWIAGCTELSLITTEYSRRYPDSIIIDPLEYFIKSYQFINLEDNICVG